LLGFLSCDLAELRDYDLNGDFMLFEKGDGQFKERDDPFRNGIDLSIFIGDYVLIVPI
jgi:hypothetical protein